MTRTTRNQRKALKMVFDRHPIYEHNDSISPLTYKQFRRGAQPTFGCYGAVAIYWAGMWLCIETDGYTHS